jgi:hypothetical protein
MIGNYAFSDLSLQNLNFSRNEDRKDIMEIPSGDLIITPFEVQEQNCLEKQISHNKQCLSAKLVHNKLTDPDLISNFMDIDFRKDHKDEKYFKKKVENFTTKRRFSEFSSEFSSSKEIKSRTPLLSTILSNKNHNF